MSLSHQKPHSNLNSKQAETNKNKQKQQFHHQSNNIDSIVRPIISSVQNIISQQFLTLHNQYLLQSYQRKAHCFQNYLLPPPKPLLISEKNKKNNKNNKKQSPPQIIQKQEQFKPTSDQILDYYNCFDDQINISVQRYQKLYKKTEQNKIRLINCVQKCSVSSKQQNQIFQTCSQKCQQTYTESVTKLYNNFYTKFLIKE